MTEELDSDKVHLVPVPPNRRVTRERAERLVAEYREALEFLTPHDGIVQETNSAASSQAPVDEP